MLKNLSRKIMSGFLAASMVVTLMPATPAQAAKAATLSGKTAAVSGTTYGYTVKNVTKDQYITVKLSGTATSATATVAKKTVKNGKTSAFVKGTGKDLTFKVAAKNAGKSYKLTVKVYEKNKKTNKKTVVKTLTTKADVYSHSISKITGSTTVEVGKKVTLKAVKKYSQSKKAVTWASSKTSVATVGKTTGVVTGKKAGTATITATCATSKKTVKVTVKAKAEEEKPDEPTKPDDTVSGDTVSGDKPAASGDTVSGDKPATSGDSVSGDTVTTNKLEMTSLVAKKANQLVAKFAAPVSTNATISITRKNTTAGIVGVESWNDDRTELTFTTTAKLVTDTYTMAVAVGAATTSQSVEVKEQKPTSIVIESTEALTNSDKTKAFVYYNVLDQYGEKITDSTSVTVKTSADAEEVDRATGKITLKKTSDTFTYGNPVTVTIVYAKGGLSETKTFTIGMEQSVNTIKVVGYVCIDDTTKLIDKVPADFQKNKYYVVYEALDKEGHIMEASGARLANKELTITSADPLIIDSKFETENKIIINGVAYDTFLLTPGLYVDRGGKVTLNVISNSTGKSTPVEIVIGESAILSSLKISAPSTIIADGEGAVLPYVAMDTQGNETKDYETIVRSTNQLALNVTEGTISVRETNTGEAEVVWCDDINKDTHDDVDRTVTITTVVIGGTSNSVSLAVRDKAYPVAFSSIKTNSQLTTYVPGAEDFIDFSDDTRVSYLDQYGRSMTAKNATGWITKNNAGTSKRDNTDFGIIVDAASVKGASANTLSVSDNVLSEGNWKVSLSTNVIKETEKKSETLIFTIGQYDKNSSSTEPWSKWNSIGTKTSVELTIVPINMVKSVAINDLKKQQLVSDYTGYTNLSEAGKDAKYAVSENVSGNNVSNVSNKAITLTGKYGTENVNIPAAYFKAVTSNDWNTVLTSGNSISGINAKYSALYDTATSSLLRKDATATLTVEYYDTVSGDSVVTTNSAKLTKNVVFSDAKSAPAAVVFADDDGNEYTDAYLNATNTDYAYCVTANKCKVGTANNGKTVYAKVFDQYGNDITGAVSNNIAISVSEISENTGKFAHESTNGFTVAKNGSNATELSYIELGDKFKLTVKAGSASKTLNVTVGADAYAHINERTSTTNKTNKDDVELRNGKLNYNDR